MITVPKIYDQDEGQISNDLLPPKRRLAVFLAWFLSVLNPLQWLHDLIFKDYYAGSNAPDWATGTNYNYGDRVKDIDFKIYELTTVAGLTPSTIQPHLDPYNWYAVLDTFVGVAERVKYTGQKIMLEYALNRYFSVGNIALPWTGPDTLTQIFISEVGGIDSEFWLSDGGDGSLTSFMSNDSDFQQNYLGDSYSTTTFVVNVPTAVDAAITANQVFGVTAEQVVRALADKYVQAGYLYSYVTY